MKQHIAIIIIIILINCLKCTWKHIPRFLSSLVYVSFFNACYYYLCKRYLLWDFRPHGFHWKWLRALHIFFITPSLVLACLINFPETWSKQVIHLIKWVSLSTIGEYILVKNRLITFNHGWNIFWSSLIYVKMYTYSYLHKKRPLLTWALSLSSIIFLMNYFNVPVEEKRLLKGPLLRWLPVR